MNAFTNLDAMAWESGEGKVHGVHVKALGRGKYYYSILPAVLRIEGTL